VPSLGRDARPAVLLELLDDYVAEGGELLDGEGRRHPEMLYGALLVVVATPDLYSARSWPKNTVADRLTALCGNQCRNSKIMWYWSLHMPSPAIPED
jgi:hypothetical protein